MAVYCAVGAIRCVMADDVDAQSDDDGGRWVRQPPKSGCIIVAPGWLAYLGSVAEEESTAEERLYKSREIILAS